MNNGIQLKRYVDFFMWFNIKFTQYFIYKYVIYNNITY